MQTLKEHKIGLGILVLIVVGISVYLMYFKQDPTPAKGETKVTEDDGIRNEVLTELKRLESLDKIDENFSADPVFKSLRDTTRPILAEPTGRSNPFSLVGSDSVAPR